MLRTYVYVDGFNFYYGCTKDTPYRWINLSKLCELMLPNHNIERIKLFAGRSMAFPDDPGQRQRQDLLLRALETLPNFEFIEGRFQLNTGFRRLVDPLPDGTKSVRVRLPNEKKTDVNLASHLLADGFYDRYDFAVIASSDSDYEMPVKIVTGDLGKPIGILNPHWHFTPLSNYAKFTLPIRKGVLAASQFPDEMEDERGKFRRPPEWK